MPDSARERLLAVATRVTVRALVRPALSPRVPVGAQRRWTELLARATRIPSGTSVTPVSLDGLTADRIQHASATGHGAVLYLHGGGYVIGSPRAQRVIAAHLARASGATIYSLDYPLAPEHPFPAALDAARRAYEWLLTRGADPARLALAGDSAGGGLALATALAVRDADHPLPAAVALLSPWLDLTLSGESLAAMGGADAILTRDWLAESARLYLDGRAPHDPTCSPLFANLSGLPPILVQVGTREVLLSDGERLAARARDAGVDVRLSRFDGLGHGFQVHAGTLRASDEAIAEVAAFLAERW